MNASKHWSKLGLLYSPGGERRHPKLATHAANPLPVLLEGDVYRIFFSGRDADNRSSVGAVDIDIVNKTVVRECAAPVFEHGPPGSFFSGGVSIANCYQANGIHYMLFMGWQAPPDHHWRGDIGRLVITAGFVLNTADDSPLLGSDRTDRISLSYPWVLQKGRGLYHMWYGSTQTWDAGNGEMLHVINFASSTDGHAWIREGLAIPYEVGRAQAFSRPTVVWSEETGYEMWFSYRGGSGQKYRIGYASSRDAKTWKPSFDGAGISTSNEGWDSEMIEYPFVF